MGFLKCTKILTKVKIPLNMYIYDFLAFLFLKFSILCFLMNRKDFMPSGF